jgi:cystathionine beta-lyase/cystathionine gamma-synthase
MRGTRRLVLKKEVLTELRTNELGLVVGGTETLPSMPVTTCHPAIDLSNKLAGCDSLLRPCISYTCTL